MKDVYIGASVALAVVIFAGVSSFMLQENKASSSTDGVSPAAVEEFTESLRSQVIAELGQPIEGFEPFMFMRVFPGLVEADFNGVDALIGGYAYSKGKIVYELGGEEELHSAARAISDEGMKGLLENTAQRLGINLDDDDAVPRVLTSLQIGEVAIEGVLICLPHKEMDGPHTLECALGLEAEDGRRYGVQNLSSGAVSHFEAGDRVRIKGIQQAPLRGDIYDVVGIIDAEVIEELGERS